MKTCILYSTPGCHLCELAKELLWPLLDEFAARMEEIDIADSDELIERYGVRIPVLTAPDVTQELGWPFDQQQARFFLAGVIRGD